VGGTHPALVEAMAAGNLVLAFGTPENREVVAGTGMVYSTERELTGLLQGVVDQPDSPLYDAFRSQARKRAAAEYSWDAVTDAYLALWASLGA
jgi:glycosyltransferase involved in cell wall biosynthesis